MDLDTSKLQEDCSSYCIRRSTRFSDNERGDLWSIASHHHGKNKRHKNSLKNCQIFIDKLHRLVSNLKQWSINYNTFFLAWNR